MSSPANEPQGESLARYLSSLELAGLVDAASSPSTSKFVGALLFIDISGFTALTEQLTSRGPLGAELLSGALNQYFGVMIDVAAEHGGDVHVFAGDALLIVFDGGAARDQGSIIRNAARAALSIRQRLDGAEPLPGTTLKLRLTLGFGDLVAHRVGGVDDRWSTVLCGQALSETFAADSHNSAGEVLVTVRAWQFLSDQASGTPLARGGVRLTSVAGESEAIPSTLRTLVSAQQSLGKQLVSVVLDRLSRGHAAFLAEFRDLTVLFVNLPSVLAEGVTELDRLHSALGVVQRAVKRLDGTVYVMLHDDKGTSIISVFGLPGQAHEDDAARGAEAASVVREELALHDMPVGIGISTGHVFCGSHGTARRAHYGIIGRTMILASRLMQASRGSEILTDLATRRLAQRWYEFEARGSLELKGFDSALPVFSPVRRRPGVRRDRVESVVGRSEQLEQIRARVRRAAAREGGGVLFVEGDAGIGKSALFTCLPAFAREFGVRYLAGSTDPLEQNTAYFAFRPIFRELLGIEGHGPEVATRVVHTRLESLGLAANLAPLLNLLLPFDIPETRMTTQMSGPIRADNLATILGRLLDSALVDGPTLMAIEDLHWMDDASLALCADLGERHEQALLLILNMRPLERPSPALSRLASGAGREHIALLGLSEEEVVELLRRRLGVHALPVALKRFIAAKSEGNPFFAEELAFSLRDTRVIEIVDGSCRFVDDVADLDALSVPSTVNGVIQSRIDRLDPRVQLTLKVASVVGRIFEVEMVTDIHPVREEAASIDLHVTALNASDIVVPEANASSVQRFRHALVHETTYGLLAFVQRRSLHSAAAAHIEHREDLAPYYARLAYHFSQAELPQKAIYYLVRAGRQALAAYANRAAAEFYSQAIELDQKLRGELRTDIDRASWHRQRAEAYYSLLEWRDARRDCEAAVQLCGFKRPVAGVGTLGRVLRHVFARHFPRSLARAAEGGRDDAAGKLSVLALQACDILQVICLWEGDSAGLAHTVFQGINIAESAGPSPEAAFARSMIGYLLSVAGLRKAGERDLLAAVEMAESEGQLLQICSTNMYLGMTYSLLGQPHSGIPYLTRADQIASELGAGLWRHRGKFMLSEPHFMRGAYARAAELWAASAAIALSAERPVAGFAHAAQALCLLRCGETEAALRLVEGPEGVCLVRDNPNGLQLLTCLAALARGKTNQRRYEEALALIDEAVEVGTRADVYNFFICHAALSVLAETVADLMLARRQGAPIPRSSSQLRRGLDALIANLRRATRTFPGAVPHYRLAKGRAALERGHLRRARRNFAAAAESATATEQPYERANALWQLGLLSGESERASLCGRAEAIFIELGVAYDRLTRAPKASGS